MRLIVFCLVCVLIWPSLALAENLSSTTNQGLIPLRGEEFDQPKENLLMRELGKPPYHESRGRRFEIVFFVSLPITLMFSYALMEGLSRNTYDRKNPDRKIQQPHYIYMFSTSILTSLYIAIEDTRRYSVAKPKSNQDLSELRFELPVVGVRF